MEFGQFLLYYLGSTIVYQSIIITVILCQKKYIEYKLKKSIKNGEHGVITIEDLLNQINNEDKKTWN